MDERVELVDRRFTDDVAMISLLGEASSNSTGNMMSDLASFVARNVDRGVPHGPLERIYIDASKLGVGGRRGLHRVIGSVR